MKSSIAAVFTILVLCLHANATATQFIALGHLANRITVSKANAVSGSGLVVVGSSGAQVFRWTSTDGMVALDDMDSQGFMATASAFIDVSADGSAIVSRGYGPASPSHPLRWTTDTEIVLLGNLPGGELSSGATTSASADSTIFVGFGVNPSGNIEAWIASTAVPEPSAFSLGTVGVLGFAESRRARPSRLGGIQEKGSSDRGIGYLLSAARRVSSIQSHIVT